jgi:hypothetical protein
MNDYRLGWLNDTWCVNLLGIVIMRPSHHLCSVIGNCKVSLLCHFETSKSMTPCYILIILFLSIFVSLLFEIGSCYVALAGLEPRRNLSVSAS